jgi:hypothetical protein
MKRKLIVTIVIIILASAILWLAYLISPLHSSRQESALLKAQQEKVNEFFEMRKQAQLGTDEIAVDPFGDDQIVRILLIGLDSRVGQNFAHCDAIQFIEINLKKDTVQITAVPRGTYAPLPLGDHLPSDYYVSKSCEVGGLTYGVEQVERIVGQKADYLVMVGFSQTMGLLQKLDLPADSTLRWLRHRQGYAIGEPQRAHNHSSFIKQQLLDKLPDKKSFIDTALYYLMYNLVDTDLSFSQVNEIVESLIDIDIKNHPDKVILEMKPAYKLVEVNRLEDENELPEDDTAEKEYTKVYYELDDIKYDQETVDVYLKQMIDPIKGWLNPDDYSEISDEEAQARVIKLIEVGLSDDDLLLWLYENKTWYQVDDQSQRLKYHYQIVSKYLDQIDDQGEQEGIITDFILEMEYLGEGDYVEQGKELLSEIVLL